MQLPTQHHVVTAAQSLSVLLIPHGGQRAARRNAWAGMAAAASRTRDRREAESAIASAYRQSALQDDTALRAGTGR